MRNICLLFFGILCGLVFSSQAQLSSVVVDPGPYTPGSTIAAAFKIDPTACIKPGNVFSLYLSDETGNFTNERLIGSYTGFYTTFINATIPSPINPGYGYKVRVRSTVPALISTDSDPFEIRSGTAVKAEISSTPVLSDFMFGFCPGRNNASFNFTNQSTPTSTVTGVIKNELNGSNVANLNFTTPIQSFNAALAHYTVSIKAVMPDGSIATRAYMVVNNNVFNNFSTSGTNVVCLPGGFLEYGVDVSSQTGIQNNYPGNTYQILWGDGITETYTFCDLKAGSVRHEYLRSSCGNPPYSTGSNIIYNVFGINISVFGPCGQVGGTISTYAKVVTKPENRFIGPPLGCTGQPVTFINTSIAGQDPSANTPECTDNDVTFNWYVDGVIQLSGVRKSVNFVYTFPTNGNHTVKLESVTNGVCEGEAITQPICIQEPPKPAFDITTSTTGCAPFLVKIEDNSFIDPSCVNAPAPTYNWIVTNANGVRFTNFTNNVKDPEILFTDPGVYSIVLEISSGACGAVRSAAGTPIIIINGAPTISLATDTKLCRLGSYLFDNIPGSPTQTIFTGTQVDLADTYTWTVTDINGNALTSADYTFDPVSNPNSKHPSINFKRNIPYIIKVTHKNTCASVTRSQRIEFVSAPTINLGADQNICFTQASVNLEANVIGNVLSGRWEGGLGTFSTPNNTTTTYTPTIAERISGLVTLKYTVTTDLQQPCKTVTADIKIFIKPEIKITSSATKIICTGTALNYAPTANLTSTSFTWTATGTANAGGFNDQATPSIFIADVLTNSDPINNATVTYTITPINDGCQGQPFTYTVTITPIPILTATPAFPSICSNQSSAITITSNLLNTRYTYTSTAPAGVTGNTNSAINAIPKNTGINDNLINNTAIAQTVTYTITPISDNNCAGLPVTVNIIVQPLPTIPIAGVDESICSKGTYTLKGNKARIGSGKWSQISTFADVVITPDNAENATVSGLVAGNTYTFRWTISTTADCSLWDDISITVNPVSVGGTTTGTNVVCAGTNSGTITLSNQVGNVVRWESSEDGTNWQTITNTTTTLTFSNINVNTSYRAVVQSGACAIAYSTETLVRTNTAAVIANAGTNQTLCNINNLQLDGNDPLTNTGLWTVESGQSVRFDDPTLYNTRVNDLVAGETYTFRWTITALAPCQPTWAEVKIFNSALLQDNTISAPTIACTNQIITVTGSTPTGGNGLFTYVWESSSDGSNWTVINGQINKDLNVTVAASLYYRRTVNSASCTMMSNIILITAIPPISKNTIAADQTICEAINPALIAGSEPTGGDGKSYTFAWEQSTDGTTWTLISGADGKDFQPPSLTQTTIYRRLVSSAACAGNFQSISNPSKITVNQNAKAEFTYANNIGCAPFLIDATNVKAVPYPALNKTYTWYVNGALLGTGIDFPGYTIATDNQTVEIKLVTESVLDCSPAEIAYTFSTRQNITAAFIQDKTEGCGPLDVMFTNTSTQLTGASFNWNFGNGTTSNLSQPGTIQFLADPAGEDKVYTITLGVTTPCGTNEFSSTVTVKPNPVALFSPHKTSGCSPFTVQFSNTSPGNNNTFTYDFGDGTPTVTTNNKNSVTHTYTTTTVQNFIVKMTASNGCGTSESQYTINVSPNTITPELVVNANQLRGCAPLSVDFFNNTIGASFYRYTFGDGSVITSNNTLSEKQTHVFTLPGTYTVELFATNGCSSATTTETITVLAQPTVAFTSDVTSGCIGSVVKFKNLSQDAVSYLWDFGDGQTSTAFEPTHTYLGQAKNYTVTLTAVNALGCPKTYAIANYIRIVPPPTADFIIAPASIISIPDYTFKFTDASTNGAQTYKWTFGDGDESTLKDPTHKFTDTGKYLVTMRTYNEFGCVDSLQKTVQIIGVPGYVYLPNSFIPGGTSSPLQKFTAVGSGIKSWRMQIFNKWGQVVWETTQLDDGKPVEGWDGSYNGVPQPQGIYFWKLDVELINGTEWKGMTYDNKAPKRTGEIYLIR